VLWQRLNNEKSRWNKTDAVIDSWLKERQQLLQQFMAATRLPSLEGKAVSPAVHVVERETLIALCNTLVDYVSMLHFEILEQLSMLENKLKETMTSTRLGLNRPLLEQILYTTNVVLEFEVTCQDILKTKKPLSTIKNELSILGEVLAKRMDLEDALIHAYVWARTALPRL
jgi:regulator of sigma D